MPPDGAVPSVTSWSATTALSRLQRCPMDTALKLLGKGKRQPRSVPGPGLPSGTSPSFRAASTLSRGRADAESGPVTVGIRGRRGNESGSPWSWREGQEYLFEHCKSKASYVGRRTSVMGNLAGETLARSCILVTFKCF